MKPTTHSFTRSAARHVSRLLPLALFALFLSACTMRALVGVDVNEDGSGMLEVTMAFDEELRTLLEEDAPEPIDWTDPSSFEGEDSPADLVDEFPEGASVSPYTEDDFEGFRVEMEFSSLEELDEIIADMSSDGEDAFPIEVTDEGSGRFQLATHGDLFEEAQPSGDEMEMFSPSMLESLFDMQLRVHLPGEVVSTNADETTEDGVMVWQLNPLAQDQVRPQAVSEVSSSSIVTILIVIVALVIGAVVAAVVFLRRNPATDPVPVGLTAESEDPPDPLVP